MGDHQSHKMKFLFSLFAAAVLGGDKKCDPTKLGTWKNVGYQICGFDDKPTWADIQKRIDENPVIVFSASYCGWSRMAKDHLARLNIPFVYQEINQDDYEYVTRALMQKFSPAKMRSTPRIFINGEDLKGASDLKRLGDAKILQKFNAI